MGLRVYVVREAEESRAKKQRPEEESGEEEEKQQYMDVGYRNYTVFRAALVEVLLGSAERVKFEDKDRASMFGGAFNDPRVTALFESMRPTRGVRLMHKNLTGAEAIALGEFISHSDCSGEFDTEQCQMLSELFQKYSRDFCKFKDGANFKETYKGFAKAFKDAADSGGKVVYS